MTWRELIFMIEDLVKTISDDSIFNEDHIQFLCGKYRNYILNSNYLSGKKKIADINYQTICLDLELKDDADICPSCRVLRSKQEVPDVMTIGDIKVYAMDGFGCSGGVLTYVSPSRFPYVGNRYTKNTIYATIGPDKHLYIKSKNPTFVYMEKVQLRGIFNDIDKASSLDCNNSCSNPCDIMDSVFPMEDAWVNTLMNLVITDLTRGIYQLRDTTNDAMDTTDDLAQAIQRYTNNAFKRLTSGKQS